MFTIYRHEIKAYIKTLLVWSISVGGMGFACILLFKNMQTSMVDMADSFASMGAFSDAFGMSQLSIATLSGFYAAEVGTIHALGGAMFAAMISTGMLSKEEDGHTSEFLYTLPIARTRIITAKGSAIVTLICLFNLITVSFYFVAILILGEKIGILELLLYHVMQMLMQLEIGAICYAISAFMKKNKLGIGLGVVLLLYGCDLITRVIPDLADYKMISPFSYANASDILSTGTVDGAATAVGMIVLLAGISAAYLGYRKRDLAA